MLSLGRRALPTLVAIWYVLGCDALQLGPGYAPLDACDDMLLAGPDWAEPGYLPRGRTMSVSPAGAAANASAAFDDLVETCRAEARHARADFAVSFVHVGKTGGTTVQQWLKRNSVRFQPVHARPVAEVSPCSPEKLQNWLITARDPVSRAVSAFNWNHPTGGGSYGRYYPKHKREPRVDEFYKCFNTANEFAEGLGHNTTCGRLARAIIEDPIEHVGRGAAFYLRGSLDCVLRQNVFVIRVESLQEDMASAARWMNLTDPTMATDAIMKNDDYPMRNSTFLSDEGLALLKQAISEEYRVIRALEEVAQRRTPT